MKIHLISQKIVLQRITKMLIFLVAGATLLVSTMLGIIHFLALCSEVTV